MSHEMSDSVFYFGFPVLFWNLFSVLFNVGFASYFFLSLISIIGLTCVSFPDIFKPAPSLLPLIPLCASSCLCSVFDHLLCLTTFCISSTLDFICSLFASLLLLHLDHFAPAIRQNLQIVAKMVACMDWPYIERLLEEDRNEEWNVIRLIRVIC